MIARTRPLRVWKVANLSLVVGTVGSVWWTRGTVTMGIAGNYPRSSGLAQGQKCGFIGFLGLAGLPLDQLDLVAVGIFDKGDHGGAEFHRAWCACDLAAGLGDVLAEAVH